MNYCKYVEKIVCNAVAFGRRMVIFHLDFSKKYAKGLWNEIKEVREDKSI